MIMFYVFKNKIKQLRVERIKLKTNRNKPYCISNE